MIACSITQAWADVIPGTEGPDELVGTPGDDLIDSIGEMMTILEVLAGHLT
jgi:hypothetical protein